MPVHIEDINARRLGPLEEFSANLKKINLIYGLNERGKTLMVEFLIKSLFKNTAGFSLRSLNPAGTIQVSGLEDDPCDFSPSSRKKLEDYWQESSQGMPTSIAQLLVVKGAELNFENSPACGVNKSIVKTFLSAERTLDAVEGKIQATVRDANIEDGEIIGDHRGKLSSRKKTQEHLSQVEELISKVDSEYSGGALVALRSDENRLLEQISGQENARRHLAYIHSQQAAGTQKEIDRLDQGDFSQLTEDHEELLRKNRELDTKKLQLADRLKASQHYQWLSSAIQEYETYLDQGVSPARRLNLILSAVFLFVSILLAVTGFVLNLLKIPIVDAVLFVLVSILIVLSVIFGFTYFKQQRKNESEFAKSLEIERIESSYKEKFNQKLTDIAALKSRQAAMQADFYASQELVKRVSDLQAEISVLKARIVSGLSRLHEPGDYETQWSDQIAELKKSQADNEQKLQQMQLDIANLGVDQDDYLEEDPQITFDAQQLKSYQAELAQIRDRIHEEETNFKVLKGEITSAISAGPSATWDELLMKLQEKYQQLVDEYKSITSRILAGILVAQVINDARQQEDEKIKAALGSEVVQRPLYAITKKYNKVTIEGEELRVSDEYEEFSVADLSTGAREQVLLALRIGFAARIMGNESAFLILDDAFQHSDWKRREYSIQTIIDLANNNWQIIYLSMDNHIRDLFNSMVQKEFKSDYLYYEL